LTPRVPDAGAQLAALADRWALPGEALARLRVLLDILQTDPTAPIGPGGAHEALDVHIADALAGLEVPGLRAAARIADIGSGAGLPGLVLAACLPQSQVALVESARRKCAFITRTAAAMDLGNVEVVCERAETWESGRDACDVVCVRALAALPVLCEYAAPLLRDGGLLLAWKGGVSAAEVAAGDAAASQLGLGPAEVRAVEPYESSLNRRLVAYRKLQPTPQGFPRRSGMAVKRPLA
jgi:16S rRNA (guanine527-N7)-methyltransferase